jgi:hypothetical protein
MSLMHVSVAMDGLQRYAMKLEKLPPPPPLDPDAGDEADAERAKQQAAAAARAVLKLEAVILSKLQRYPFVSVGSSSMTV